ncbi:sterol desaturase family protein [Thiosulfatihalobacter marinus]|uniref:sterol desaturase family protein n=1 Tax=Thiosulfatihalobacter marinus TaxID=2792481 RepID=UPI0018D8598F|nr:sterol desaturase family protein [Thiosulfatihalobacter marinus]
MTDQCLFSHLAEIFSGVFATDLLRYVVGAGGVYLAVNLVLAARLRSRKIRASHPPRGQIRREILASLRTVLVFALNGTLIVFGAEAGIVPIYTEIGAYGWIYLGLSTAVLIVAHDAWFYWSHRLLHYPPLFRRFHRLHHKSHNPTPFTSYSFDLGEAVVNAVYLPLILLVLPAHPVAILIFVTHMMLRNAIGHSGYELFPANRHGKPLFDWMTTVTHHDLHHAHAGYNLGLYFTWWDRLMGTEHPGYHAEFHRAACQRPMRSRSRSSASHLATEGRIK